MSVEYFTIFKGATSGGSTFTDVRVYKGTSSTTRMDLYLKAREKAVRDYDDGGIQVISFDAQPNSFFPQSAQPVRGAAEQPLAAPPPERSRLRS